MTNVLKTIATYNRKLCGYKLFYQPQKFRRKEYDWRNKIYSKFF